MSIEPSPNEGIQNVQTAVWFTSIARDRLVSRGAEPFDPTANKTLIFTGAVWRVVMSYTGVNASHLFLRCLGMRLPNWSRVVLKSIVEADDVLAEAD